MGFCANLKAYLKDGVRFGIEGNDMFMEFFFLAENVYGVKACKYVLPKEIKKLVETRDFLKTWKQGSIDINISIDNC